ncbi:MAG: hypothetical protein IKS45_01410, partial [Thermoguttaceae bacterium]|nr:hypothetical protein [Thermoguttaceae bacterium]
EVLKSMRSLRSLRLKNFFGGLRPRPGMLFRLRRSISAGQATNGSGGNTNRAAARTGSGASPPASSRRTPRASGGAAGRIIASGKQVFYKMRFCV